MSPSAYANWSKDELIERIQSLEAVISSSPKIDPNRVPKPTHFPRNDALAAGSPSTEGVQKKPKKQPKPFDFSVYPKRKIALKFCYFGWEYYGLAFQPEPTPLPMVEAVLLQALGECRLIDPEGGLEGCGWSRCGRTDRNVSGAGQVVALWVRSAIGATAGTRRGKAAASVSSAIAQDQVASTDADDDPLSSLPGLDEDVPTPSTSQDDEGLKEELKYVRMLNSVLPRSIRVLAWSPVGDDFDARFSCMSRHYKYFFSPGIPPYPLIVSPPPPPEPSSSNQTEPSHDPRLLDISLMRDAAARLVGEHDFRNFCKIDPSKQVDNYNRRILSATIIPVDTLGNTLPTSESSSPPPLYVLDLKGNGFLYHQVRHIMAILFLVGARLEAPTIVDTLLDTSTIVTKPVYNMADGLPLVLWDCSYPEGALDWRFDDRPNPNTLQQTGDNEGTVESSRNLFYDFNLDGSSHTIKVTLLNHFARAASQWHAAPPAHLQHPGQRGSFRVPLESTGYGT
ncbi:hypothetical protein FRB99_005996 [Tulasnella sp. 403]|nr:hypothetical protein FRB99_005996 [Tulasnella sp. 403]